MSCLFFNVVSIDIDLFFQSPYEGTHIVILEFVSRDISQFVIHSANTVASGYPFLPMIPSHGSKQKSIWKDKIEAMEQMAQHLPTI